MTPELMQKINLILGKQKFQEKIIETKKRVRGGEKPEDAMYEEMRDIINDTVMNIGAEIEDEILRSISS